MLNRRDSHLVPRTQNTNRLQVMRRRIDEIKPVDPNNQSLLRPGFTERTDLFLNRTNFQRSFDGKKTPKKTRLRPDSRSFPYSRNSSVRRTNNYSNKSSVCTSMNVCIFSLILHLLTAYFLLYTMYNNQTYANENNQTLQEILKKFEEISLFQKNLTKIVDSLNLQIEESLKIIKNEINDQIDDYLQKFQSAYEMEINKLLTTKMHHMFKEKEMHPQLNDKVQILEEIIFENIDNNSQIIKWFCEYPSPLSLILFMVFSICLFIYSSKMENWHAFLDISIKKINEKLETSKSSINYLLRSKRQIIRRKVKLPKFKKKKNKGKKRRHRRKQRSKKTKRDKKENFKLMKSLNFGIVQNSQRDLKVHKRASLIKNSFLMSSGSSSTSLKSENAFDTAIQNRRNASPKTNPGYNEKRNIIRKSKRN